MEKAARDGRSFAVRVQRRPFAGASDSLSGVAFLGGDGDPPRHVLERLEISVAGEPVVLPRESWIDLSDPVPGGIRVDQGREALVVHVVGSDGAGSYRASLLIREGKLVGRRIEPHGRPPRDERF